MLISPQCADKIIVDNYMVHGESAIWWYMGHQLTRGCFREVLNKTKTYSGRPSGGLPQERYCLKNGR